CARGKYSNSIDFW
nr:immunoglobulin heavy chain junction region [Macaca mulatta]